MNWTQFKKYLEKEILQEEESEEEDSSYTLFPEAKTKYSISKEEELLEVLTNLIESIENQPYLSSSNSYSSLSEQDEKYYPLPSLTDLINEKNQPLTWKELFPNREEAFFGKKEDSEKEIPLSVWTILEKIFNDWIQSTSRSERLKALAGEDNIMMKFLLEAAISLNYELIKRKGYDRQLKDWMKEYNLLEEEEKEDLEKQKDLVDKLLTAFEEETQNRQKATQSWYHNIPWMKVIWYGAGGLLVILVIGWLKSKLKK